MAVYLGYTLRMKTLFHGWPIMVNDTHTTRRRRSEHGLSVTSLWELRVEVISWTTVWLGHCGLEHGWDIFSILHHNPRRHGPGTHHVSWLPPPTQRPSYYDLVTQFLLCYCYLLLFCDFNGWNKMGKFELDAHQLWFSNTHLQQGVYNSWKSWKSPGIWKPSWKSWKSPGI